MVNEDGTVVVFKGGLNLLTERVAPIKTTKNNHAIFVKL